MKRYNYNPQLRGPGPGPDTGTMGVMLKPYIAWCNLVNSISCRLYKAGEGVTMRSIRVPVQNAEIPCYVFVPQGGAAVKPAVLYFHGGGFMMQIFPMILDVAVHIARELDAVVFLPQYRTTPKYKYPIPVLDCYHTLEYVAQNASKLGVDGQKLLLYGDSAGGCLATETAHMVRDKNGPALLGQVLVYPVTDVETKYPSHSEYEFAAFSKKAEQVMWNLYLDGVSMGTAEYYAPLHNKNFADLPPAYIEVAEMDTLRDGGLAYAEKLRQAGVYVEETTVPGAYHGYDGEMDTELVQQSFKQRFTRMKKMLAGTYHQ